MAKQNWLPRKEADRRTAVDNLADKLPGAYATKYGLTTGELTTLENFRLWFNWTFTVLENVRLKAQGYTGFRDDLAYGTSVANGNLSLPQDFTLPAMPASGSPAVTLTPVANGFGFVATLVARIKGHAAYAVSDGNDLGLEGPAIAAPDPQTTKPLLAAVLAAGGHVEVQWKKSGFTGVRIEVDRGNGIWVYLATDTVPHYIDTLTLALAAGTTALWKYRAIYLEGDQVFGQWSDAVSIAVTG